MAASFSIRAAYLAAFVGLSACASSDPPVSAPAQPAAGPVLDGAPDSLLLITGVRLVDPAVADVSGPVDLLISVGRIASVSPAGATTVPAGTPQFDGQGLYALPGLIDVHAHVGEGGIGPVDDAARQRALDQFLRYGVTSIFVPGATGGGDADFPAIKARCANREMACPDLYGSGSLITAPGSHPVSTIFGMGPDTPADVIAARGVTVLAEDADIGAIIAAKAAAGFGAVKIVIEDGPPPWYPRPRLTDAQVAAIVEAAHANGLKVFAHISMGSQVEVALDADVDGIMHAPTDRLTDAVVARMAEQGMWYVPTFSLYDGILTWARGQTEGDPYAVKGVPPETISGLANPGFLAAAHESEETALAYLDAAKSNLLRLQQAGGRVALGSDVNNPFVYPGYSAHEELVWMVAAGLSPAEALNAATAGGAAFLGAEDRLGRIAPGFEADLLLVSANPLEDIRNVRSLVAVIADGELREDVITE